MAVDAWYHSSDDVVGNLLRKAFRRAADLRAQKVAVVALATGYGRLSMEDFARGLHSAIPSDDTTIRTITVVVQKQDQVREILAVLDNLASRL